MVSVREKLPSTKLDYYSLTRLGELGLGDASRLPMTIKILLEGLLRQAETGGVEESSLRSLTHWPEPAATDAELPFLPTRILMQ